ncbi:MAG: hypothetical protein CSYNP_02579 [Syntrophus sp. SKADARSKE-3]|nr:hypothetical protein [Syntrophus sp. SKADARSKE-3]
MSKQELNKNDEQKKWGKVTRRDFIKYSVGTAAFISLGTFGYGCSGNGGGGGGTQILQYPIDSTVVKTTERMISFPYTPASAVPTPGVMPNPADPPKSPNGGTALTWDKLSQVSAYDSLGYGAWAFGAPLPIIKRTDIMPKGYDPASVTKKTRFLNFVSMSDIHLTDKEAPNQLIYLQQGNPGFSGQNTSIYSPIMVYTPHVFDAAIQTVNALHKKDPFDFFISLGDACNSSLYNELRWYIDIIDGKVITPSSGAHIGADTVDYQMPFKAAGLDPSIPLYQALGNHDHFMIGSFPVYADPNVPLGNTYISDTVWSVPKELLIPDPKTFPAMFSNRNLVDPTLTKYYGGVIDGSKLSGSIIDLGPIGNYSTPPKVAADPNRRALMKTEWISEFFNSTSSPAGHGFGLVDPSKPAGFACYSFVPKSNIPLKIIVLDDTQNEDDGSVDIHGHGFLDPIRWAWLQAELAAGKAANQLMIIAAHIPIAVSNIANETEWWLGGNKNDTTKLGDPSTTTQNAVDIVGLVNALWNTQNVLMWISGHRHVNVVKGFPHATDPEKGFWQVETSSLHDFPQQFRTFEIYLNSDYTISIETVNVDPAVAEGTPAATSRKYAIAAQQIVQNTAVIGNSVNYDVQPNTSIALPTMDPSRAQGTPGIPTDKDTYKDLTIQFVDLSKLPTNKVPFNASYNAQLFKQLSPAMKARMQALFP